MSGGLTQREGGVLLDAQQDERGNQRRSPARRPQPALEPLGRPYRASSTVTACAASTSSDISFR